MNRPILLLFTILFLLAEPLFAQDLSVFNCIGKNKSEIIKAFGQPAHIDNSIPSMVCIFYKNPNMVFVLDETGIYQADIVKKYSSEKELRKDLSRCIEKSIAAGFRSDTLSAGSITLRGPGVTAEVVILSNNNTYKLKIEAKRHE